MDYNVCSPSRWTSDRLVSGRRNPANWVVHIFSGFIFDIPYVERSRILNSKFTTPQELQDAIHHEYTLLPHQLPNNIVHYIQNCCKLAFRSQMTTHLINEFLKTCNINFSLPHFILHFLCSYLYLFFAEMGCSAFWRYVRHVKVKILYKFCVFTCRII